MRLELKSHYLTDSDWLVIKLKGVLSFSSRRSLELATCAANAISTARVLPDIDWLRTRLLKRAVSLSGSCAFDLATCTARSHSDTARLHDHDWSITRAKHGVG